MAFAKAPRMAQDNLLGNRVASRSFKVYSDSEKNDTVCTIGTAHKGRIPLRRKSVTISTGTNSGTKIMKKGSSKIMGKAKSNRDSFEDTKVGRKALTDLSNLAGNGSRNAGLAGSSMMKHKSVKSANLQSRISVGSSSRFLDISSRKSIEGKEMKKRTQVVGSNCISTKDAGDTNYILGCQVTERKNLSIASTADGTRKSLPALKRTNLTEKISLKKNNGSSAEAKELCEVSRFNKKVIRRVSSVRSYLWENRASDGFILPNLNSHSKKGVRPLQRKSFKIQTTVKTSLQNSNSQKKPQCPVGGSKSRSIPSIPSKEEVSASSLPEKVPEKVEPKASNENTQGESSSYEKTDSTTSVPDVTVRPKSKRRRSFTSSLVTRSEFTEEQGEIAEQEKLPNIDDESNQLEVAEYVDDIYQFYWVAEAQNPPLGNYMAIQTDITAHMRGVLINWLIEVHFRFDLMPETLYLTVNLLDRYLSQVPIKKNEMQLTGLTALLLASKYEDFWHPRIKDLISISAESYTREQILGMENIMLREIKFRLNAPTPYVFMLRFLKAAQSNKKLEQLVFYLIELCLVQYEALKFKSSLLCASAIYVARCTLRMTPVWTPLLSKHTHYDIPHLRDCAEMILKFHKAAKTGKLRVTYEKYMNPDHNNVAVLKPLDKLPL